MPEAEEGRSETVAGKGKVMVPQTRARRPSGKAIRMAVVPRRRRTNKARSDERASCDLGEARAPQRIFSSTNSTCLRTFGSYFLSRNFSVLSFLFLVVV